MVNKSLALAIFLFSITVGLSDTIFPVRERLDCLPSSAFIENKDGITLQKGRFPDQQAIVLAPGASLIWHLPEKERLFIDFWVKPVSERSGSNSSVLLSSFRKGDKSYYLQIRKKTEGRYIVLEESQNQLVCYPVYGWGKQPWMKEERPLWHYICLVFEGRNFSLWVDGFPASRNAVKLTSGSVREFSLKGAGNSFSSLEISEDLPSDIRHRYRCLYQGLPEFHPNTVLVPLVKKPPTIDGEIEPGEWDNLTKLGWFCSLRGNAGHIKAEKITVFLGYDKKYLYLLVRTPYSGKLNYRSWKLFDMPLWGEESWEIFIHPPFTGTPDFCQLIGNPASDQADLKMLDLRWNGRWDWKAVVTEKEWTAEFRADFLGIGTPVPVPGDVWTFNMVNTDADAGWCWTQRYNDTGSFGRLIFGSDSFSIKPGPLLVEKEKISVPVQVSGGEKKREIIVCLELYGEKDVLARSGQTKSLVVPAGKKVEVFLSAGTGGLSSGRVVIAVKEKGINIFYHSILFPESEPTLRQGMRVEKVESVKKPQQEEKAAEEAYNRRWSAQQLGETLLESSRWKEEKAGLSENVPPPWSPMEVEGQKISCWGRTYEYQESLFPATVISQGKTLIGKAPYLLLKTKGKQFLVSKAKVETEKINAGLVRVKTKSETGPFQVEIITDYEFDGMAKAELKISCPEEKTILTGINLVIPLSSDCCHLYHYTSGVSGHAPASDSGIIPEKGLSLNFFREILWFGDTTAGFSWFAESLENWPVKDEEEIEKLGPAGGKQRLLTIKLGDKPFLLERVLRYVFGFGATPVKPRPADFRRKGYCEAVDWRWFWGDGQYYPFFSHPEKARQHVQQARSQGKEVMPCSSIVFHGLYRFYESYFGLIENPGLKHREMLLFEPVWRKTTIQEALTLPSGRHTAEGSWYGKKFQPQGIASLCPASDFQDYYLWQLAKLVKETGLGAIYLDQPLTRCASSHHRCGYINYKGEWTGRLPIFAMRNMMKRMYNIFVQQHGYSFIRWHSSNQIPIPFIGFIDIFWDGENYGSGPQKVFEFYSKLLPEGKMQSQHTGIQFGFIPDLLPEFEKRYAPAPASIFDMVGYFMVHDSTVWPAHCLYPELVKWLQEKRFSFDLKKMKVAYYWQGDSPVSVTPETVKFILHYGQSKGLLVLFNSDDCWQLAKLKLGKIFPGNGQLKVRDVLTEENLSGCTDNTLFLPVCARDLRMIEIFSDSP